MTTITRYRGRTSLAISLIAALLLAMPVHSVRAASNSHLGIVPPDSVFDGHTYGGWSALWWQYVLAQPLSANPTQDLTGAHCGVGQSGPVFFLVGTFNGPSTVTRNQCTVPAGNALFFPLVNNIDAHIRCSAKGLVPPPLLPICDTAVTPQQEFAPFLPSQQGPGLMITELHASIDGVPVSNLDTNTSPFRACAGPVQVNGVPTGCTAPAFSVTVPDQNLFDLILPPATPLPASTYTPAVADGAYLMLTPLTPGAHMITFGGTESLNGGPPFMQDITYNLIVSS